MKRSKIMNAKIKPIAIACALALASGPAMALTDVYLIAKEFTKTLPDGSSVTMWGYAEDVAGACYAVTPAAARLTDPLCVNPVATAPGPELVIPPGEPDFRIFLTNQLPVPTSIFMSGQERPHSNNVSNGPTWNDGTVGSRTSMTQKVRSYGREAAANGGRRGYVWRTSRGTEIANPGGTFTYYSGTEPQLQVYMGLYGAAKKNFAAGSIYDGVPFVNEQVLFYSEIDPDHNAAVAAGDPNYTPIHYHPEWFLINGEPYVDTMPDIALGNAGEPTLLRFLSAASEKHVPVLQGLHGVIHAEDGIRYNWQNSATGDFEYAPREQYSVGLPPLKTKDVIVTPALAGRYAVYDGNGNMTNPSDPEIITQGDTVGGMLRFLSFGTSVANLPPVPQPDTLTIEYPLEATTGVEGVLNVLANDSDPEGMLLSLTVANTDTTVTGLGGVVDCLSAGGCTFTPEIDINTGFYVQGTGTFNYAVSDGVNEVTAQVSVEMIANEAPSPVNDDVTVEPGATLDFNVLLNDLDNEGDALEIVTLDTSGILEGTLTCDNLTGLCTYVAPAVPSSNIVVETFTYTVTDNVNVESAPTGATITVQENVPVAPVGVTEHYVMLEDTVLDVAAPGVLDNDSDGNGDPITAVLISAPLEIRDGLPESFVLNPDGSFHFEPAADFSGTTSFVYVANDGTVDGGNSELVTVTIEVTPQNDAPQANADTLLLTDALLTTLDPDGQPLETIFNIPALGVLANDVDLEGDTMTAAEVNDPDGITPELVGVDGAATITVDSVATGIVGSLTYQATDSNGAVSLDAQADFVRLVSINRSEYNLREDANPANDDWRIRGRADVSIPPGTQVHVYLVRNGVDVAEIVPHANVNVNNSGVVLNNANNTWSINANNIGPEPQAGDTLRVEVEGFVDAVYTNYPVHIMP
ncbi:MAG: Ig-like domain-containing protein [Candidatus Thiodiazotropha sp. LLP2]